MRAPVGVGRDSRCDEGKELFDRLRREQPGVFLPGQLRTLQRRVRDWRRLAYRRLLFVGPTASPQDAFGSPIAVDARNETGLVSRICG